MQEVLAWFQLAATVGSAAAVLFAVGRWRGKSDTEMLHFREKLEHLEASILGADGTSGPFLRREEARLMEAGHIQRNEATDRRLDEHAGRIGALEASQRRNG